MQLGQLRDIKTNTPHIIYRYQDIYAKQRQRLLKNERINISSNGQLSTQTTPDMNTDNLDIKHRFAEILVSKYFYVNNIDNTQLSTKRQLSFTHRNNSYQ